ncbi:uncharacterized protein [Anabrus simplex]|uniref:uncharacterized protein n=1 Tax=Anabrus simplex TaxID=316456 RepID=UPI0035A3CF4B
MIISSCFYSLCSGNDLWDHFLMYHQTHWKPSLKDMGEAPCGTCKPPAPCKPISSTTSFLKPCPGAGKKSARKKQFTDDGLSGLGRDREDLEMADALLCSPSLRKGEKAVKVDDEDVGNDDAGEEDEDADESEREEEREEVGEVPSDSGDEEGSEIYYTAPGSAGPDLIGGYPVYKSSGMDLNLTPMPSGMLDEPAPHRPVFRRARQAFIGKLPESFEELYNTPLDAPLSSWNYPEAPDYRGDDQPIPTMELLQRVWEDQDYYRRFPYNLSFVPDRPLEFHVQHAFGHPDPAYFNRFRLMPPRLADVPKEERPPTIKFFEVFRELSPSEYEEMLQQEEEDDTGDEYPYPYPYP